MLDLESEIRELIDVPRTRHRLMQDRATWFQICSSLDVIGDTNLAIDAYVDGVVSAAKRQHTIGTEYLVVYGLLQVLFVQQDAVEHLCKRLDIPSKRAQYLELLAIRNIRNASVGHPTQKNQPSRDPVSYHFISRVTLHRGGFQLLSFDEHGGEKVSSVSISSMIADQRTAVFDILRSVVDELSRREAEHRAEFEMEKLADAIPATLGYAFEKLGQAVRGTGPRQLGEWAVELVQRSLNDLRDALARRDIELDTYDSIGYVYEQLTYPIEQLGRYLRFEQSDIATDEMAGIVVFFVKSQINKLTNLAEELDTDYSAGLDAPELTIPAPRD